MNFILLLLLFLLVSSHTSISYITFLFCMVNIVLSLFLLGNSYLSLVYFIIYVGSIAILFIYILMVFSLVSSARTGYFLFFFPFLAVALFGWAFTSNDLLFNLLTYSYSIYNLLLLPLSLLLFVAMIFAIRAI